MALQPIESEVNIASLYQENETNLSSGSEQSTKPPSMPFLKKTVSFRYLIYCLLFVCLAPVIYACGTIVTFAILPLLLVTFVVVRVFQFVNIGEEFEKHFLTTFTLRYWIFVFAMLLLLEVGIFYPFAKYIPGLEGVLIVGLPITKWIKIICILTGIYLLSQVVWLSVAYKLFGHDENGAAILEAVSEIIGCLLFWWAEVVVMNNVTTFRQSKVLGLDTQKWIKVSLFLLIGHDLIVLLIHILVWLLPKFYRDSGIGEKLNCAILFCFCEYITKRAFNTKYVVYVATGIKRSVIFILSTVMLLLTWVLYFGNHLNTTSQNNKIVKFGTWTLVSVLVCSFLCLIKSCILLYWEAHVVYDRLHFKISNIAKQLYFLVLLSYSHFLKFFEPSTQFEFDGLLCAGRKSPKKKTLWVLLYKDSEGEDSQIFNRITVREKLIDFTGPDASVYDIQQAGNQFLTAQYALSKESNPGDINHLQSNSSTENHVNIIKVLKNIVLGGGEDYTKADWTMLLRLLSVDEVENENISLQKVKTWMERAHNRCMFLANTLISEKEAVKCLNQVMTSVIIFVTFIMWLLLTELATTSILVLIASPLLAATFVFGDTCKSLFQGLIFIYVVHPFDVGDLCLIDDKLLEVKRIGVWSTIFSKVRTVGKQHEVIYPNSELSTKNVINYKTEFDWNDYIEFSSSSTDDDQTTKNLKHQIETYLDNEKERFIPNFHSVEILDIGDKDKVTIHMKHNVKTEGWTYFECLKEKEKRRFEFALYIRNLLNKQESKTKTRGEILSMNDE